ncbi:MAG: hypothetical protein RLY70_4213 [Planctomycetota bacterium]|jgi:hypothetical protein
MAVEEANRRGRGGIGSVGIDVPSASARHWQSFRGLAVLRGIAQFRPQPVDEGAIVAL